MPSSRRSRLQAPPSKASTVEEREMIMNLGYRTAQRAFGAVCIAALCVSMGTACSGTIEAQTTESNRTPRTGSPAAPTPTTNTGSTSSSTTAPPPPPPVMMMEANEEEEETEPSAPPVSPGEPAELSFEADVWPIFNTKCGSCHVTSGLGGQNIGSADKAEALEDSVTFEAAILMDLTSGSMPIGCGGGPGSSPSCVTQADFDTIEAWYDQGAPP